MISSPSFSSLYQEFRKMALFDYRVSCRLGVTPPDALAEAERRLMAILGQLQGDTHGPFKGRRYGAYRRLLSDVRRGRKKMAQEAVWGHWKGS